MAPICKAIQLNSKELTQLYYPSVTDFASTTSYLRSFQPSMLLDIWAALCENVVDSEQSFKWQVVVVNQTQIEEGFLLVDCQAVFKVHSNHTALDVGTLVVLVPESRLVLEIFGIVEQLEWKVMSSFDKVELFLLFKQLGISNSLNKDENFVATFQLRVKQPISSELLKAPITVSKVSSLCPMLNQLFLITELDRSPLRNIILQPSKHEEAFQLVAFKPTVTLYQNNRSLNSMQYATVKSISQTILNSTLPKIALLNGPPGWF